MPLLLKTSFWFAATLIGVLSLLPVPYLPPQAFDVWDKAQHAGAFAGLAILCHTAYKNLRWRLSLALLAYGAAIELAQSATGWRYGDWLDLLADALGILVGGGIVACLRHIKRPR
jgi:VanZ family protein